MLKIYGSINCPDCRNCKANFDLYNIKYEFIEVLDSLKNLKEFLHYRDNYKEVFERLIKIGDIGLPTIIDDDKVFTDWEGYLVKLGLEPKDFEKTSCSIGSKNC